MSKDFEKDERRQQEIRMRPIIDAIYQALWPGCAIKRFEHEEDLILDKEYAIDVEITFPTGQRLLGQEKALSYIYRTWRTVTIEFYNDPIAEVPGDWFTGAFQFYFVGYVTKDELAFDPWVIVNYPSVVIATLESRIKWEIQGNTKSPAKANFKYTKMDTLPPECIIAFHGLKVYEQLALNKNSKKDLIQDSQILKEEQAKYEAKALEEANEEMAAWSVDFSPEMHK